MFEFAEDFHVADRVTVPLPLRCTTLLLFAPQIPLVNYLGGFCAGVLPLTFGFALTGTAILVESSVVVCFFLPSFLKPISAKVFCRDPLGHLRGLLVTLGSLTEMILGGGTCSGLSNSESIV